MIGSKLVTGSNAVVGDSVTLTCRRADVAAAAGAVLDDDLLAPHLAEVLGDETAEHVDCAGWRERDHDLDRPGRVILRRRTRIAGKQQPAGHGPGGQ
jgi:hypothetical protein